jgi:hypothetical protein
MVRGLERQSALYRTQPSTDRRARALGEEDVTPSRLIGFRMRVRIYDDRLECFVGQTLPRVLGRPALTLCRGRSQAEGRHGHVVDYRHSSTACAANRWRCVTWPIVTRCSRVRPRLAWERLLADGDPRRACKSMVSLLALAHDRGCEAELAAALTEQMTGPEATGGGVIDAAAL